MIQIQLKAKHYYYIIYNLKDATIRQYFSLIQTIKTQLSGNTDFEALYTVSVPHYFVTQIFKVLTYLPEGQAATINAEMMDMLMPQVQAGVIAEMTNGLVADGEGNLPETAYWQRLAADITYNITQNVILRNSAIQQGYELMNQI